MTLNPHSEHQNLTISIPGNTENLTLKKTNIIIGANGSGKLDLPRGSSVNLNIKAKYGG